MNKVIDKEVLVSCQGISKKFCRNLKKSLWYGVKDGASEILTGQSSHKLRKDEFWALKDISFELRRGECLGLLGRNGAGKTTLLKVLSGLIKPDQGTVSLKGRIGGLIALGAGFNGILSGRENIRINGSILGYSRDEIEEKMQEIIDFAEIPEFIDAPVNTYSSGMSVRLGFAIAAILTKPDVLLLDEVLAVGDISFTIKCLNVIRDMMKSSSVIFVSHNLNYISMFCTHTLFLKEGRTSGINERNDGVNKYLNSIDSASTCTKSKNINVDKIKLKHKDFKIPIENDVYVLQSNDTVNLQFRIYSKSDIEAKFGIEIQDEINQPVVSFGLKYVTIKKGNSQVNVNLKSLLLNAGKFSFVIGIEDIVTRKIIYRIDRLCPFIIETDDVRWGKILIDTNLDIISLDS